MTAGLWAFAGCMNVGDNPYEDSLNDLTVRTEYPEGYESFRRSGVDVKVENTLTGDSYTLLTRSDGSAEGRFPNGIYRISLSDRSGGDIFNATRDGVRLDNGPLSVSLSLLHSKAGTLVIKELYVGGCSRAPQEGTYQADQYMIIHNNDNQTVYLDSLCLGTLSPYNSNSSNPWADYPDKDFVPIIQAIWQIGGTGITFPLAPGADAVICLKGAIDHSLQYPLSVNLNNSAYFVCYNSTYFPNTTFHPAPGDQIRQDHILGVAIKTGQANAYAISITSPAMVIFRAKGTTIQDYVLQAGNVIQIPGSSSEQAVCIPYDWVIDGVEVYDGRQSGNSKRLPSSIDAGYVTQTDTFHGHSLFRRTDEEATAEKGFEVLMDTNNSSNDLYERQTQSLHE